MEENKPTKGHEYTPPGLIWAPWVVCTFHITKWDKLLLRILNTVSPRLWLRYFDYLKKNRSSTKVEHNLTADQLRAYNEKRINNKFYGTVDMNGTITNNEQP